MLKRDADVRLVSFKAHLMGQLPRAAVQTKVHAVISTIKYKENEGIQDDFSNKEIIICR